MLEKAKNHEKWSIELARKRAGLTQEEISDKLNMSRNSYRKYENGEVVFRTDKAWQFSQIVDIPFEQIIFFKPNYTLSVVLEKDKEGGELNERENNGSSRDRFSRIKRAAQIGH